MIDGVGVTGRHPPAYSGGAGTGKGESRSRRRKKTMKGVEEAAVRTVECVGCGGPGVTPALMVAARTFLPAPHCHLPLQVNIIYINKLGLMVLAAIVYGTNEPYTTRLK